MRVIRAIAPAIVLGFSVVCHAGQRDAAPRQPAPDCVAHVGYDRDGDLRGYVLPMGVDGASTCVPFTTTAAKPPADYHGDFYVDEFTDAKLVARWNSCRSEPGCRSDVEKLVADRRPPNRDRLITDPRRQWLLGKVPDVEPLDLATIRRPAFFGQAPWKESIAALDPRTFTVEFTVGAEPFERLNLHSDHPVKLRGWYIRGEGVPDGKAGRRRSLIVFSAGGGGRIAAIEDPGSTLYAMKDGKSVLHQFPDEVTGASGERVWRAMMVRLHDAGFDVLCYDRRGVGLSTGYSDTNTLQQGRDILVAVAALDGGRGLRVLIPGGATLTGRRAAAALLGGVPAGRLPVILAGSSRGSMATGWAMARNFYRACDYDLPDKPCHPALGLPTIVGAIQLSDFSAGPGYLTEHTDKNDALRPLFIAGSEEALHISFFPSSEILASIRTWPALFIARGLYDYAESLDGAIAAYDRVNGLRELVVVRGPHPIEVWPAPERARAIDRMIAFATAATFGRASAPGSRPWADAKSLVATAGAAWEPSTPPR